MLETQRYGIGRSGRPLTRRDLNPCIKLLGQLGFDSGLTNDLFVIEKCAEHISPDFINIHQQVHQINFKIFEVYVFLMHKNLDVEIIQLNIF